MREIKGLSIGGSTFKFVFDETLFDAGVVGLFACG